jgi:phage baseplate assembly protein W
MNQPSSELAAPSEDFFRALELERTQALVNRDMPVLQRMHAPEYQLITPAGSTFSRERYLSAVAAEPFYAGWEAGAMQVRVAAEMAIVRYQARLRFPSGKVVVCWHTDSYERRAGAWQAVWSQATEVPSPAPSA